MNKYALIIDHESCWGCKTCEVACKQENHSDEGIKLIAVSEDGPKIVDGKLDFIFHVNVCRHCDDPPCVDSCPEEAITKRKDGIVVMDYDKCTGCQSCIEACPYNAIAFDIEKDLAQKCNLCHHRVDKGLLPACADNVCLAHCIYFGDPEEINPNIKKGIPPCLIFIDKEGCWFYEGAEMIHRDIIQLFYQNMELDSLGRYAISWNNQRCYVEVEDTAFVVRRVDFKFGTQAHNDRFDLSLSDETVEELLPDTLCVGQENVLYCKVKGGAFPARFTRAAYYQLARYFVEENETFCLPLNGSKYKVIIGKPG